ncbi:hypothetical protein SAMN05444003_2363 [Cognatiyoonia sediminum]|uniref:O-Antigen ligase n=1 Tax=Cognatiyoonia sediminum TaxID=1508389 RepID=A0A1M5QWK1_9RHOB|nr:hypothetical protein [Cognatiyoonia sediminum]SHH18472.1 hypothetical protein SAMN05444003_2363 [Cognatiyoonia sediminum]
MAMFAILTWPFAIIAIFRKWGMAIAVIVGLIGAYLLLPTETAIDLPLLPALDKNSIPSLFVLFLGIAFVRPSKDQLRDGVVLPGWLPRTPLISILMFMLVFGAILTGLTNGESIAAGPRRLPGLTIYDALSGAMLACMILIPVLLARKFLGHPDQHLKLLIILSVAGMIYSLPTLYEVRMSPQLNRMVYGFFPHSWQQHIRGDGFRPIVFLSHGLWLGIFLALSALATVALTRVHTSGSKIWYWFCALWLAGTLLLSKNLGASVIFFVLLPVVWFFGVRLQLLSAAIIAAIVLTYPILRGNDLVPTNQLVSLAQNVSAERAGSLQFRFVNEDIVMDKAQRKPIFGWGGWGRQRVYDDRGRSAVTLDGRWVIVIGTGGWIRYLAEFGLLTLPILLLWRRRNKLGVTLTTSCLAILLAGNTVDLLPNSSLTPVTWILAGALIGRLEIGRDRLESGQSNEMPVATTSDQGGSYTRFRR